MMVNMACLFIVLIGLYCVAVKHDLIKKIIGLIIMEYGAALFCSLQPGGNKLAEAVMAAGLATTIIMAAIAVKVHERFKTLDVTKIRNIKG